MKFKMSFGAVLALFSFACAEQNAAANSASGENLGDIEVVEWANNDDGYRAVRSEIGKTTKRILEIPQTVNVVTQQHLKDKKARNLSGIAAKRKRHKLCKYDGKYFRCDHQARLRRGSRRLNYAQRRTGRRDAQLQ